MAEVKAKAKEVKTVEPVKEVIPVAKNEGSDIAAALVKGLKDAKGGNFELSADEGVDPRFTLVRNKNGEVMLRDNTDGTLSKIQLESIEEKEASIQDQEVTEL